MGELTLDRKYSELLQQEADKSIRFLVSVRDGEIEGKNLSNRIAAAKILIDKVYPSGGDKSTDRDNNLRIEVVDASSDYTLFGAF
ncbi:hypothetical protein MASR1M107_24140 [Ignavibacteriales bacterium]